MRVLVTGAAGMLGQAVARRGVARGHQLVALARAALDVTDPKQVDARVRDLRPHAIINCAAFTDVDGSEAREAEATAVNGAGAGHLAHAAAAIDAHLVHVGSDYVFAGDGRRPLTETSPVGPRSAYGRSKLAGEAEIAAAGGAWTVVRSAWLYGAGGRNFVDTIRSRAVAGGPLRVVDDQFGSPTWSVCLANAILNVLELGSTGIVHFSNGGAISWRQLALAIVEELGLAVAVEPLSTPELGRPAPRPAYSALDTSRYRALTGREPLAWRAALARYLSGQTEEEG